MSSKIIIMGPLQHYSNALLWLQHRAHTEMDMPSSVALDAGGARVFDALASHNTHQKMRSTVHRRACHRSQLLNFALSRMPEADRALLVESYTSFGAGRASYTTLEMSSWRGACLLPIILRNMSQDKENPLQRSQGLKLCEALAHSQKFDTMVELAKSQLVELVAGFANEVTKILDHLDRVADRTTASAYRKSFEHVEH